MLGDSVEGLQNIKGNIVKLKKNIRNFLKAKGNVRKSIKGQET